MLSPIKPLNPKSLKGHLLKKPKTPEPKPFHPSRPAWLCRMYVLMLLGSGVPYLNAFFWTCPLKEPTVSPKP